MANAYYSAIQSFQTEFEKYVKEIFKGYENELLLIVEGYNPLAHDKNCLESSTAFGFIIEEFLVSRFEKKSKIQRIEGSTANSSYDCFSLYKGIKIFINIKVQSEKNDNNAISAINKLCSDYFQNPEEIKAYLVLKIHYSIKKSDIDGQRKIFIDKINSFFLEEIDFSKEHMQDKRNWSDKSKRESGRLMVSEKFRVNHQVPINERSYENTKKGFKAILRRIAK